MDSSSKIVRDPVYKQFKALIKGQLLQQSRWPAGAQIATERDLAKEYNLSRVTVSKALSELEAEGLIEKRPPGGTFVTEKVKSRGLIKFLFYLRQPLSLFPGYALLLSVLESRLAAQGIGLLYTSTISDDPAQARAWVVVGPVGSAELALPKARIPTVTVDFGSFLDGVDGVEIDNAAGAQKAVAFLYEKGHRRIAYLGCCRDGEKDEWPNSERRRAGYLAGLREFGLESLPAFQRMSWAEPRSSGQAALALLNMTPTPTAVVCFSQAQALGVLEAARTVTPRRGRVFEAVCFSDKPGDMPIPGMSGYCVVPWQKIADAAVELVLRRMEHPDAKVTHTTLAADVIEAPQSS